MQIVTLSPERRPELFELLRVCLGERETSRRDNRFWSWKHENNPFGSSMLLLGEESGSLVGLRAFMHWQWLADGKTYPAVRAVDTVTHPDHQRKGIFSRLTQAGLASAQSTGMAFVFNTPNPNSMPGYLKMGWQHVARLPMQVRVLNPYRFAAGLFRTKLLPSWKPKKAVVTTDEFRAAPQLMTDFLNSEPEIETLIMRDAALRGGGFTTARSIAFLRWRYAKHPYVSYYVEAMHDGARLRGALIWRTNTRFGLREVMVCDVLLDARDPSVARALVSKLRSKIRADYLIAHFGSNSSHRALLGRCGFFSLLGQGMNFTVRDLGRTVEPDPFKAESWSLCLGDLEIF